MKPSDLMEMEMETIEQYWQAVECLEAQEIIAALKVSDFPYLKKEARKEFHRSIYKKAFPASFQKPREMTFAELQRELSR